MLPLLGCAGNGGTKAAGRLYGIIAKPGRRMLQITALENLHLEKFDEEWRSGINWISFAPEYKVTLNGVEELRPEIVHHACLSGISI